MKKRHELDLERKEEAISYLKILGIIKDNHTDWIVQFSEKSNCSIVDLMVDFANMVETHRMIDFAIECAKDEDIQQLNKEDRYDENVENFVKHNYNKTYK